MTRALLRTAVLLTFACGCVSEPVATAPSNNPEIQVDTLFTHDGCTIYRFRDGQLHYYVTCREASAALTTSIVACGKNCTRPEEIQTVSPPR